MISKNFRGNIYSQSGKQDQGFCRENEDGWVGYKWSKQGYRLKSQRLVIFTRQKEQAWFEAQINTRTKFLKPSGSRNAWKYYLHKGGVIGSKFLTCSNPVPSFWNLRSDILRLEIRDQALVYTCPSESHQWVSRQLHIWIT